ncbi:MAG: hypothetical protein EU521_00085 [Promethearchaeota archaeon]|nr:MAG: hypothetical protein EU521_00085 [Candidatus Lokiarchaeota archaeon]
MPAIFEALIDYEVYGQKENARVSYNNIGKDFWPQGEHADACLECGECETKCPQNIPIIQQLKYAHNILSG